MLEISVVMLSIANPLQYSDLFSLFKKLQEWSSFILRINHWHWRVCQETRSACWLLPQSRHQPASWMIVSAGINLFIQKKKWKRSVGFYSNKIVGPINSIKFNLLPNQNTGLFTFPFIEHSALMLTHTDMILGVVIVFCLV